jgi:hypothetical protein
MTIDRAALGAAIAIELALTGLAALGGPHGTLGALPWILQLPGIVMVVFVNHPDSFVWRVLGMVVVQTLIWYAVVAGARRGRRRARLT